MLQVMCVRRVGYMRLNLCHVRQGLYLFHPLFHLLLNVLLKLLCFYENAQLPLPILFVITPLSPKVSTTLSECSGFTTRTDLVALFVYPIIVPL